MFRSAIVDVVVVKKKRGKRRDRRSGGGPGDLLLVNTTRLPGCLNEIGKDLVQKEKKTAEIMSASAFPDSRRSLPLG